MEKTYAYKNTEDILKKSSSGGAFWGIAETFFDNGGGICYGAKFNSNFQVKHSPAHSLIECRDFQGSKYVQSDIGNCFKEIHDLLSKEGVKILFTGTPCQVAAIKQYMVNKKVNLKNLYTVDIVCHGTPSPLVWEDFVNYLEKSHNSKLKVFSFRYKEHGWKGYPIYAEFENGEKYINTLEISTYQNMFRKNLLMREACFHCPYPGKFQSDMTICDFWGVEVCAPQIDTKNGVSLIQVHTEKGSKTLSKMKKKQGVILQEVFDDRYKKYNHNLVESTIRPENYDVFWEDYRSNGMEYILCKYGDKNFIGKIKFYSKDFLRKSGIVDKIKKIVR